eukprot:gene5565-9383_t
MATLNFKEVSKTKYYSIKHLGGKGYNLIKLTEGGFNVPQGFLISTEAFQTFLNHQPEKDQKKLSEMIKEQLSTLKKDDGTWMTNMEEVKKIAENIRQTIEESPMPEDLEKEILEKTDEKLSYAVRSSGTAEDTEEFSFAGQYETYLNIDIKQIIKHVKLCWSSLFTERGIIYRATNGFMNDGDITTEICVVVQQMVHSEKSGVMFTANPVNGNRNIISIDACFGLGEALVSGKTNADSYLVSKKNYKIQEKKLGDKKVSIIHLKEGGTEEIEIKEEKQKIFALEDKEIIELAKIGADIQKMYGSVQDIEWGSQNGKFFILQSRAVTSLFPLVSIPVTSLKKSLESPNSTPYVDKYFRVYFSMNHAQMFQDPFRPLGMSLFTEIINATGLMIGNSTVTPYRVTHAAGRLYVDITDVLGLPGMDKNMEMKADAETAQALKLVKSHEEYKSHRPHLEMNTILTLSQSVFKYGGAALWAYLFTDTSDIQKGFIDLAENSLEKQIEMLNSIKEDVDLFPTIEKVMLNFMLSFIDGVGFLLPGFVSARQISDDPQMSFLSGIQNLTTEMGLKTGDLTDIAREFQSVELKLEKIVKNKIDSTQKVLDSFDESDKGEAKFKKEFSDFIKEYGHRCQGEIDITNQRWSENSIFILTTIYNGIHNGGIGEHRERFKQSVDKGNHDINEIIKKTEESAKNSIWNSLSLGKYAKDQVTSMKKKIQMAKDVMTIREHPKFYIIKVFEKARKLIQELAKKFVKSGIIDEEEDIYYLYIPEIEDLMKSPNDFKHEEVQALIKKRKVDYLKYLKMNPPAVMTSEGEDVQAMPDVQLKENQLQGMGVSKGRIEGFAKVIFDPLNESIQKGEIMVTSHTDPGWTPLFMTASGLITEVGGILTHGSVVAREMGIPAVVGVKKATKIIKSGDYLKIDGTSGIIEIVKNQKK